MGGCYDVVHFPSWQDLLLRKQEPNLESFIPSILLTNPQSLTNCFEAFKQRIKETDVDVAAVSETWFSTNHPADDFQLDGYTLFHDDREQGRRGGGVALYVRTRLVPYSPAFEVPEPLECIWAGIGPSLFLCSLYHPPRAATGKLLLEHVVNTVLDIRSTSQTPTKVVVIGDFNELPHERLYSSLKLKNLVMEPTHKNSVIDLILTDVPALFGEPQLLPPIGGSQHNCVLIRPAQVRIIFSCVLCKRGRCQKFRFFPLMWPSKERFYCSKSIVICLKHFFCLDGRWLFGWEVLSQI